MKCDMTYFFFSYYQYWMPSLTFFTFEASFNSNIREGYILVDDSKMRENTSSYLHWASKFLTSADFHCDLWIHSWLYIPYIMAHGKSVLAGGPFTSHINTVSRWSMWFKTYLFTFYVNRSTRFLECLSKIIWFTDRHDHC